MTDIAITFWYKLAWATLALSLSSMVLAFLANRLNAKSHRLMAISGFAPLAVAVSVFCLSWQLPIPRELTESKLPIWTMTLDALVVPHLQSSDQVSNNDIALKAESPFETPIAVEQVSRFNSANGIMIPARTIAVSILLATWLFGLIWKICFMSASYARLCMLKRTEFTEAREESQVEWQSLLKQQGCTGIPAYESSVIGPALCLLPTGYSLVVPRELWSQALESDRKLVMRHELAHYRRNHIPMVALCRAIAAVHWFNPLAKACVTRFERACEWQADDDAIEESEESAVQLAKSLVYFNCPQISIPGFSGSAKLASNDSQLKTRVSRLLSSNNEKEISAMKILAMIVTLFTILALATAKLTVDAAESNPIDPPSSAGSHDSTSEGGVSAGDATESPAAVETVAPAQKNNESGKNNPFRKLFDEIAKSPRSPSLTDEVLRKAFQYQKNLFAKDFKFESLRSIVRTEKDDWVTYEFESDPLEFFHEITYLMTRDKSVADEVLNGFLKDINGPRVDMRQILKEDIKAKAKLICHFIDETRVDYLVEVGLVNPNTFLPKFRQVMKNEAGANPKQPDYSHVVFQSPSDKDQFPEFNDFTPTADQPNSWAAAVREQRFYWGTVELVEQAIK